MDNEKEPQAMKIVDKRRFDSSGNERSEEKEVVEERKVEEKLSSTTQRKVESPPVEPDEEEGDITLSSFIMSLATQAMMQLGEIAPPSGVKMEKNLQHAKQTIDILSMIFNKTQGNRDETEEKLFDDILHSLRISFIRASGGKV